MNIIAPLNVAALRVSPSTAETVKPALYDFSVLGTSPLSSGGKLIAADQLLTVEVDVNREPGIHLHWSVPKAYTRGVQSNLDGSITFPGLPNRWLVTRFLTQDGTTSTAMWLLEADAHAALATSLTGAVTTMPWMDDSTDLSGLTCHYVGRRVLLTTSPATSWSETAVTPPAGVAYLGSLLQAPLAYGETFTAYYRHARNLFGMYDDLTDVFPDPNQLEANCQFSASYSVLGWVTPQANDAAVAVLTQAVAAYDQLPSDTRPAFADYVQQAIESELQWTLDSYASLSPDVVGTAQGVLSGVITGIEWQITKPGNAQPTLPPDGIQSYPSKLPDDSDIVVAIGNNNAEALSAYLNSADQGAVASDPGDVTANLEWLLNALQCNQLPSLGAGELGVGQLDQYLHARSFGSRASGSVWSVRRPMTPGSTAPPQQSTEITLPLPLAKLLAQLNDAQQQYDALADEIFTRQQKLFFDWAYHINAIEANVVGLKQPIGNDVSGAYLFDGLLQLFPRMASAGASGSIAPQGGPYSYAPAAFSMSVPASLDTNLPGYVFNRAANGTAAATSGQLLDLYYTLAGEVPASTDALATQIASAMQSLTTAQAGGASTASYVQQAVAAVQSALQLAAALSAGFAKTTQATGGAGSIKAAVDAEIAALQGLTDPATGVFATHLPVTSTSPVPAPAATTYTGKMASYQAFVNAGSWAAQATGGFNGMGDLIDRVTGQGAYTPPVFDTQTAGVYLAAAYGWRASRETAVNAAAYYVQLAQLEVANAQADAQAASAALQQALTALADQGAAAGAGQLIAQVTAALPPVLVQLSSESPDIAGALASLQSLPDLAAPVADPGWTAFTTSLETAWMAVLRRLPVAHQVSLVSTYLAGQVQGQYQLGTVPAAPYWQPNEPVILLAESGQGDLIRSIDRNGVAAPAACRLDSETLQPTGAITWPSAVTGIQSLVDPQIPQLGAVLQRLLEEAYLLNLQTPSNQMSGTPPSAIAVNAWPGNDVFLPLFIFWQADYLRSQRLQNSGQVLPADFLNDFTLDDYQVGYQPTSTAAFPLNQSLYGVVPLSSSSTANLSQQIVSYCTSTFDYDPSQGAPSTSLANYAELELFYDAYREFQAGNVLSQGLSGFNASLRQRVQELQLPLNVPQAWTDPNRYNMPASSFWPTQFLLEQSATWPTAWSSEAIDFNGLAAVGNPVTFQAMRAGFMAVTKVTLVDVFGRFVSLPAPPAAITPVIAETLQSTLPSPANHPIYLPPRLLQPSRMVAQWVSASSPDGLGPFTEWNPHPAASPICGWLIPNHLDRSVMLYDADGTPLGSLGEAGSQVRWFAVPGQPYDASADNRTQMLDNLASQGANPALQAFAGAFAYPADGTNAFGNFDTFLGVVDDAQQFIVTKSMQQDQSLAVLVGQPLVLARMSVALQLQGLPDVSLDAGTYMPWNGASAQFQLNDSGYVPYNFANFNDGGITSLQVPLGIGAVEYEKNGELTPCFDDGVVGFFLNDDYTVFYTPVSVDDAYQVKSTALTGAAAAAVTPGGAALTVTLLLDPRAAVHVTTGVLPVAQLSIPPDQYSAALARLLVTFLTAPVLQNGDGFTLPVPSETGFEWSWWQVGQSGDRPIGAAQVNTDAVFPNTPQTIVDGWLKLKERS